MIKRKIKIYSIIALIAFSPVWAPFIIEEVLVR